MFRFTCALIGFWIIFGLCAYAAAQSCLFTEPASSNCWAPRVIPGNEGHHVVLMDTHAASDTGYLCSDKWVGNKVYFTVTPEITGWMTVSTCHPMTMYDTVLQVSRGGELCETGTIVACDDDTAEPYCSNACGTNGASKVVFWAQAGVTYNIRVGSFNNNPSGCSLCLGLIVSIGNPCGDIPRNFICQEAMELPGTFGSHEAYVDVADTPSNPLDWSCASNVGHPVWFKFTSAIQGFATFSTCHANTTYDTVVRVLTGCSGYVLEPACNDDTYDPECTNSCSGRSGKVTFPVRAGVEYLVAVGAYNNNSAGCDMCLGVRLSIVECRAAEDCDDANPCTIDTCGAGTCEYGNERYGTACMDDGNPCTNDICDGQGGCTHPAFSSGTACGDPANTACTNPDTCDGAGTCLANDAPYGAACMDDGNPCTNDICDGLGGCTHPASSPGTACGDPSNTACTNPDTCDGAGACLPNNAPYGAACMDDGNPCTNDLCDGSGGCIHPPALAGTACGDSAWTACTSPDTCDGAGTCLANHASAGTPCPDAWFCNGLETCSGSGDCGPGTFPCLPNETCNEDTDSCDVITDWYVTPADSIQEAIDAAFTAGGGIVHVAPGSYFENITMRNNVKVLGAGAGTDPDWNTILNGDSDGDGQGDDSVVKAVNVDASAEIEGVFITNGSALQGGGIFLDRAQVRIRDCWIHGNTADSGGGIFSIGADPLLVNCIISNNAADYGGGIAVSAASNPVLINCTVVKNTALNQGGGLYTESFGSIRNSILWNNHPDGVHGNPDITFSDVHGGFPGTGNLDQSPWFVDIDNADYHLQAGSPCLDAGSNDAVPDEITEDFLGLDRIMDSDGNQVAVVDMGAFETPSTGLRLSGYVRAGQVDDHSTPLADVTVALYCADSASFPGDLSNSAVTDEDGWYWMLVPEGCIYANIQETDPAGFLSSGAATKGGIVKNDNWIQYVSPFNGKALTDNNFWDVSDPVPGDWQNFMPDTCTNTSMVTCSVGVSDTGSGLDVSSALYSFSTDGGTSWGPWQTASCSGADGSSGPETITANIVPFGQDSGPGNLNRIKFWIADLNGNISESSAYSVAVDTTPPQITTGPVVSDITRTSAGISWQTGESADSTVQYGKGALSNEFEVADPALVKDHQIFLTGLEPSATYGFTISSTDACGNTNESSVIAFETEAEPDDTDPVVSFIDPGTLEGMVTLSADASDNNGIEKVEFLLDEKLVFTSFSSSHRFELDTTPYINGQHKLTVKAYDLFGRVTQEDRFVNVANIPDASLPVATITTPGQGDTVTGLINVKAHLSDDTGLKTCYAYFTPAGAQTESFVQYFGFHLQPKDEDIAFMLDTSYVQDGYYRIGLKVYDKDYNIGYGTCDVHVKNAVLPDAKLVITQRRIHRHENLFTIELTVTNQGQGNASDIKILEYLYGFQPIRNVGGPADYTGRYNPSYAQSTCEINYHSDIPPGVSRVFTYNAIPILIYPVPHTPQIGSTTWLTYKSPNGKVSNDKASSPVPETTGGEFISDAHKNAAGTADYLIITNPGRLYNLLNDSNVNILLSTMAHLGRVKQGVLGYMDFYDGYDLRNLIQPGGIWAKQLAPAFSKPLSGYVMLVGETEILPAWFASSLPGPRWGEDDSGTVNFSDHPYADTGNGPGLIVARVIGDTASAMTKTIQTSINIHEGVSGYAFNRDNATMISGPGLGNFMNDVETAAKILTPEFAVKKMHWQKYYLEETLNLSFDQDDVIAAGDVLGGSNDEIIIGDDSTGKIYVYDGSMTLLQDFSCGYSGTGFDPGDKIAVGNFNIVMADVSTDYLLIYNGYGILQNSLPMNLEAADGLALGDVTSDGYAEIVLADASENKIYVYTIPGIKLFEFSRDFQQYDRLAVGNIVLDAKEEIIILDRSANSFLVFSATGQLHATRQFSEDWAAKIGQDSLFSTIQHNSSGNEHILFAPAKNYEHLFLYLWDADKSEFGKPAPIPFDFDSYDGLAVGNIIDIQGDSGRQEILVADGDKDDLVIIDSNYDHFVRRVSDDLPNFFPNADVIYWTGHGNVNVFDGGLNSHWDPNPAFPLDFSGHNPVVLTSSCLTGNYQAGDNEDKNIAESFLASGASVYIGASQVSFHPSAKAMEKLMSDWTAGEAIGKAFTEVERYGWAVDGYWKFYAWEHNFYGDPKFGVTESQAVTQGQEIASESSQTAPPSFLAVDIPDYTVTSKDGLDRVEIPDGHIWFEPGQLQVPFYATSVEIPSGFRVQDVILMEKSSLITETDLNVPMTPYEITGSNFESVQYTGPVTTSFPDMDYQWNVMENSDGTSTLVIVMYPFHSYPETLYSRFYGNFSFEIVYNTSNLMATSLTTDKNEYRENEIVTIDLHLNNPDAARDIIVSCLVKRFGSDEVADDLELRTLSSLGGTASFSALWDSSGMAPGCYSVEAALTDTIGNNLEKKAAMFHLGLSSGNVSDLHATPEHFDIGDEVTISMAFTNTGTLPVSGKAVVQVKNDKGDNAAMFQHDIIDMPPGNVLDFVDALDTSGFSQGIYRIAAYVSFNSKATQLSTAVISTSACTGDLDHDGDVDGKNLETFSKSPFAGNSLATFASEFGSTDCLGP